MMIKHLWPCALLASLLLAGCSDSDVKEVKDWMAKVKSETKVAVTPLSEPKTFVPYAYAAKDIIDPFSANKLLAELARAASSSNSKFRPDTERRKELLEEFPLDTIRMVGIIQKGGVNYAVLQVDKTVHRVAAGQHIGPNYGVVTSVTESAVTIRETVQDATGDWMERMAKLELQAGQGKETRK
jgi:type IV pilus assembly protein PilP